MKSIQITLIIILVIFIVALLASQNANPDSLLFGVKRIQEKVYLTLKGDPKTKVDYLSALLDLRLKEFENIIKNESYSYIWSASLRYSTFAGQIADVIVENNLTDLVEPVKKQFEMHKDRLTVLYEAYPKNTNNVEWKYILDAINYLNANLEKLSSLK